MRAYISIAVVLILLGCQTPGGRFPPSRWLDDLDAEPVAKPRITRSVADGDQASAQFFQQVERSIDVTLALRRGVAATGLAKNQEALNTSNFDEVPDSTWFTNRIGRQDLSRRDLVRGANHSAGLSSVGPLRIQSGSSMGEMPVLLVEDNEGAHFILRFDPKGHPALVTGAELISNRLMHAVGYNVPEVFLVEISLARLELAEDASYRNWRGRMIPLTTEDLETARGEIEVNEAGRTRAIASKLLPGQAVGPFKYVGRRTSDKNDLIPHQNRRELRGLQVFSAWVNYRQAHVGNTMDMFVETGPDGHGHVKHYLTDFSSTLGSAGAGPVSKKHLYDYKLNYGQLLVATAALGAYHPYWEKAQSSGDPSVGLFESAVFQPSRWKPLYPNPAFQSMTARDGFWGAKIAMRFSDDDIAAIVDASDYPDAASARYITEQLIKRRDKIGADWFRTLNPLDDFELSGAGLDYQLRFRDLSVEYGFARGDDTRYRFQWLSPYGQESLSSWQSFKDPYLALDPALISRMTTGKIYILRLQTRRREQAPSPLLDVYLKRAPEGLILQGIMRR